MPGASVGHNARAHHHDNVMQVNNLANLSETEVKNLRAAILKNAGVDSDED